MEDQLTLVCLISAKSVQLSSEIGYKKGYEKYFCKQWPAEMLGTIINDTYNFLGKV